MESVYLYAGLFALLELFEVWWQKAPTLYGVVQRVYDLYKKSIFLVLFLHPTLYLAVYLMITIGYDLYLQILFGLKLSDIALKLLFVKKVFFDRDISNELAFSLQMKIEPYMLYMGVVLYPILIVLRE